MNWGQPSKLCPLTRRALFAAVGLQEANHLGMVEQNCYVQAGELVAVETGFERELD